MSKILRKCLSLVLVIMLLASITIGGVITVSADNKTGDGLAAYAMTAYNEGWQYVWGGASYGYVDCSGLIYSYVGGGARVTEAMVETSPEWGYVSDGVPDIPGLGLWQDGHVGVYVGDGMAVDARDEISNVCYAAVSSKSWVKWFKVAGVSYGDDASLTNSTQVTDNNTDTESADDKKYSDTQTEYILKKGDIGSDVNALQERLKELGYFTDDTTEYFGNYTEACLKEFQAAAGLEDTGIYDEITQNCLLSDNAPIKAVQAESDTEESDYEIENTEKPNLTEEIFSTEVDIEEVGSDVDFGLQDDPAALYQQGDEDDEVSNIQYLLILEGYYEYNITGIYDENTACAVAQYQLDNDLDATGVVDELTYNKLFGISEEENPADEYVLIEGMEGEAVTAMQERLVELRYLNDMVSGVYDSATVEAVKFFQEYCGYASTNFITQEQLDLLFSGDAPKSPEYTRLRFGYTGGDVRALQKILLQLSYLSYDEIEEQGVFDESTERAVEAAQAAYGIDVNGIADGSLVMLLDKGSALNASDLKVETGMITNSPINSETTVLSVSSQNSENTSSVQESVTSESENTSSVQESVTSESVDETTAVASIVTSDTSSEAPAVDVPKTGVDTFLTSRLACAVVGVSLLVVLFLVTIHYWNVSMEKRRKRVRKSMTVSVYKRRYM